MLGRAGGAGGARKTGGGGVNGGCEGLVPHEGPGCCPAQPVGLMSPEQLQSLNKVFIREVYRVVVWK